MMMLWTAVFWKSAAERAISTAAQAAVAVIGVDAVAAIGDVPWQYVAGVAATAGVLSVLKSVAASHIGNEGTPSLVRGGE
jgi:hypothetical protein